MDTSFEIRPKSRLRDRWPLTTLLGLSPMQHAIVAAAAWSVSLTIAGDVITICLSPLFIKHIISFLPCLFAFSFEVVFPCCGLLILCFRIVEPKPPGTQRNTVRAIARWVARGAGITLLLFVAVEIMTVTDMFFPIAEMPLITVAGALLLIPIGEEAGRRLPAGRRRALIAAFMLPVLGVRYIDWIETKPFIRDLYKVHRGMTGAEVEQIMKGHLRNYVQPESEWYLDFDPHFTGETWYRVTNDGWGNADWGKVVFNDGRAVDAEDCLCD